VIGFIYVGAHGDGADAEAGPGGSASGFCRIVLTIEDGSLQGDAAQRSEDAKAVCGQVVSKKIIIVGCREEETAERLEVRFTREVSLVLEQTPAARQMKKMILIGETLHSCVFAGLNHGEGGKQQTVIILVLKEEAGADVLSLRGVTMNGVAYPRPVEPTKTATLVCWVLCWTKRPRVLMPRPAPSNE
jgi:hypothetical protein